MEASILLTKMFYIIIPIATVIILIMLAWQYLQASVPCQTNVTSDAAYFFKVVNQCADKCWSAHNFGKDVYNDDCYVVDVMLSEAVTKTALENSLQGKTVKVYFDSLKQSTNYKLKIRYNSSAPEISLLVS